MRVAVVRGEMQTLLPNNDGNELACVLRHSTALRNHYIPHKNIHIVIILLFPDAAGAPKHLSLTPYNEIIVSLAAVKACPFFLVGDFLLDITQMHHSINIMTDFISRDTIFTSLMA
jgi:hypothetical protein